MLEQEKKGFIPNLIKNGKTQPVVDYKDCIFERVYVETAVDTDLDGKLDLIAVYIRRPKETLAGYRVPAIYVANPYMMTCNEKWYVPYGVDKDLEIFSDQNIKREAVSYDFSKQREVIPAYVRETAEFAETAETVEIPMEAISDWYSYFNSRGYASVFCGGLGTRGSEGVTVTGSREEVLAFKAVIDWLNGRCRAFTDKESNIEIKADWCSGNVAMSGKSYLGTLAIGVAMTGVEGLKTIVPEAAISNWYAYDRYNGLNVPPLGWQGDDIAILSKYCCSRALDPEDYPEIEEHYKEIIRTMEEKQDRNSGNYNEFWDERNYLNLVDNLKASVFIVHGLNDWNVKLNQCIPLWDQLVRLDMPRRMMLHQGEHIYIHNLENAGFNDIMHQWMDYWLYELPNGTGDTRSEVRIQSNLDQNTWYKSENWCATCTDSVIFPIEPKTGRTLGKRSFIDALSATGYDREKDNTQKWRYNLILSCADSDCFAEAESVEDCGFSLTYDWEMKTEMRICGTVKVDFEAAIDKPTAILSAMLVDIGEDSRLLAEMEIAEKGGIVWGKNTPAADEVKFKAEEIPSAYRIITRGWMNAQNRTCAWSKETLCQGKFYNYSFDMIPNAYTVRQGHKLRLIIYGTDPEATQRPFVVTTVTVLEDSVAVRIPCDVTSRS